MEASVEPGERAHGVLPDEYAISRWGVFVRPDAEDAFLAARFRKEQEQRRANLWAATVGVGIMMCVTSPRLGALAVPVFLPIAVLFAATHAADRLGHRKAFVAAALSLNLLGSCLAVAVFNWVLPLPEFTLGWVVLSCVFQFAAGTEFAPVIAALPIVSFASIEMVALSTSARSGFDVLVAGFLVAGAFVIGAVMAVANHRLLRRAYAQERIIEAQRATIERQQDLLKKELSHQVAERSRELGNVLAQSDVTLDARRLSPGERFAERYKIVASLGAGGMGAVYEVERVTDGARLALKAVVGEVSGASAARFAREAEIGARVHHPHLVSIVDVGVSTGVPYLVMEIVRGGSLEAQRDKFGDVAWALPILRQIAEGLAALHEAGVVHRDLKPANVLIDGATAKISDFGISRFGSIDDASVDANANTMAATPKKSADLTATNMVMGTPLYMAPEGAKTAKALDASADVFAFGIIAYEMLTGRSPFAVPAFVLAMAEQPIPTPTTIDDARVPDALRALVQRALAGDASTRPRVREIIASLSLS